MKKSLICCLIFVFLISFSLNAYCVTPNVNINSQLQTEVVINLGESYKNRSLIISVYNPAKNLEDLKTTGDKYNEADETTLLGTLNTIVFVTTDNTGTASFTYYPGTLRGLYKLRISGEKIYTPIETSFSFKTNNDAQEICDTLKIATSITAFEGLFTKYESDEIYASYQLTELDKTVMYSGFDKLTDPQKALIYQKMYERKSEIVDKTSLANLFNSVCFWAVISQTDDTEKFLDDYGSFINISAEGFYNNIIKGTNITAAEKTAISYKVKAVDFLSATNPLNELHNAVLLGALSSTQSSGVLASILNSDSAYLSSLGIDYTYFDVNDIDKQRDLKDLQPFATISDLKTDFESVYKAPDTSNPVVPTPPTTSSGFAPSGGTSLFIGNSVKDENKEEKEETKETTPSEENNPIFTDIDDVSWAHDAIYYLYKNKIINGRTESIFAPNDNITRAEFAKMIVCAYSYELAEADFIDVDNALWYAKYVGGASKTGVMNGYNKYFYPDKAITREEAVTVLYRIKNSPQQTGKATQFSDFNEISEYAQNAVSYAVENNIVSGKDDNKFAPKSSATRAEIAKILYNFINIK